MQFLVFIVGPAGAGKSTFTAAFRDWLASQETPASCVNMDPAVENLEYLPDVDIREYVYTREVMEKYSLGPNGAIIASMDLILEHLPHLDARLKELGEGYVLIDTPGQMEIFAFRKSGKYLVDMLCEKRRCATVFISDAVIIDRPGDLISQLLMSASIFHRFTLPQVNIVNKMDLLSPPERERVIGWIRHPERLENDIVVEKYFIRNMYHSIREYMELIPLVPVSAKRAEGFDELYVSLHGIYMGGEDYERTTSLIEGKD